ncbi:unnamed protein product [Triticum turgidum subsp. durum]|uniref:Protein kinase domain-containing protein n=1 Tax=Triticum turgidum subsp. durum TaxID=4567 RepID=A0A9R0ZEH3_TRITD|nr:unnamed protein product [Triticum turgidum subsp. durum]
MDLRFLSYYYAPLKVIGLASMSSFTKVVDLARLNHENIAKFLGYCRESDPFSRMLVFEYASNGTLYKHLHYGKVTQFSWLRRMKIAIGIAQGLRYLYTESQPPFAISEPNSIQYTLQKILPPRLTTSSTEAPPATRWESSNLCMGVGTQIRVASLHKAMVNAPTRGSLPVFVR